VYFKDMPVFHMSRSCAGKLSGAESSIMHLPQQLGILVG